MRKFKFEYLIYALAIIIIGSLMWQTASLRKSLRQKDIIFIDTVNTYKNKLKEEYDARQIFINDKETLEKYNKELAEERDKYKDRLIFISNNKVQVKVDTVYITKYEYLETDSDRQYNWTYDESNLYINGTSTLYEQKNLFNTKINTISMLTDITTSVIEQKGKLILLTKSSNPYVTITNPDASFYELEKSKVFIDYMKRENKKVNRNKRFGLGLFGGYGFNYGLYDGNYKMKHGLQFGIGLTYDIIKF